MNTKDRKFIIWEEAGVVSFAEIVNEKDNKVVNPCILLCDREEQEYVDERDGLTKKKHIMNTRFVPYTYDAIFDTDKKPEWNISPTVTILDKGIKFRPELIDLYDGTIHSTSAKKN